MFDNDGAANPEASVDSFLSQATVGEEAAGTQEETTPETAPPPTDGDVPHGTPQVEEDMPAPDLSFLGFQADADGQDDADTPDGEQEFKLTDEQQQDVLNSATPAEAISKLKAIEKQFHDALSRWAQRKGSQLKSERDAAKAEAAALRQAMEILKGGGVQIPGQPAAAATQPPVMTPQEAELLRAFKDLQEQDPADAAAWWAKNELYLQKKVAYEVNKAVNKQKDEITNETKEQAEYRALDLQLSKKWTGDIRRPIPWEEARGLFRKVISMSQDVHDKVIGAMPVSDGLTQAKWIMDFVADAYPTLHAKRMAEVMNKIAEAQKKKAQAGSPQSGSKSPGFTAPTVPDETATNTKNFLNELDKT